MNKNIFFKNIILNKVFTKADKCFYFENYPNSYFDKIVIYEKKHGTTLEIVLIERSLFIADAFIKLLTKEELTAIFLHEEYHLKKQHMVKAFILYFTLLFLSILTISKITMNLFFIIILLFSFNIIMKIIVNFYLKYCEYSSDLYAAVVLNDVKEIISALETYLKIEEAFQKKESWLMLLFSSHPSLKDRIEKLKKEQLC